MKHLASVLPAAVALGLWIALPFFVVPAARADEVLWVLFAVWLLATPGLVRELGATVGSGRIAGREHRTSRSANHGRVL